MARAVSLAMLASLGLSVAQSRAQVQGGEVYRGFVSTGIWVELADDGRDQYELAVLDGLPGQLPQTRFITLVADRSSGDCILVGAGVETAVSVCPEGAGFTAGVTIGQAQGQATFQAVGWSGSFAWGRAAEGVGDERTSCQLESRAGASWLMGSPLGTALAAVAADAQNLPSTQTDTSAVLARLRVDRLRAYAVLALRPDEAAEAARIADAVAGRPVLGRSVSLAQATLDQSAFTARVVNSPVREHARQELRQVDRALAEIYDPTAAASRAFLIDRLKDDRLPSALRALESSLSDGRPALIGDLIAFEGLAGELDACVQAVAQVDAGARSAVSETLFQRSDELVEAMRTSVATAGSSTAGREALQQWEGNASVVAVLRRAGRQEVFASLRNQVVQIAQEEDRARLDGERRAAQRAAADNIAPTTRSGRFQADRVARSVVRILHPVGNMIGSGTGFIVAPGIVVTNVHVIEGGGAVYAVVNGTTDAQRIPGTVIAQFPIHDIAILRIPGLTGRTIAIAGNEPAQGSDVWALGFPGLADDFQTQDEQTATLTTGIVSRVYSGVTIQSDGGGETRLVQHTAQIAPGSSGGPLFDACHRVVGVNTQLASRNSSQVLSAVSSGILPELLRQQGVTPQVSSGGC
ncbi:S1C family serine protease [Brevundimonas sp.]|uniref:S1C family serine protease n=1 Tax=Brevundimonas sp. TaxID=1871086 RepID=UPI003D097C57